DMLLDHIEEFMTGRSHRPDPDHMPATAVSTDTISSARQVPLAWAGAESRDSGDAIAELERCGEILACGEDGQGLAGLVARAEAVVAAARGSWSEAEAQVLYDAESFRRHWVVWEARP